MSKATMSPPALGKALVRLVVQEHEARLARLAEDSYARLGDDGGEGDGESVRPDLVGAAVLLGRALAASGLGLDDVVRGRAPLVVQVPAPCWVKPVGRTLRICTYASPDAGQDGDGPGRDGRPRPGSEPVVFARDGLSTGHRPDKGNETVWHALQSGMAVIGIASEPERLLPSDLVRASEMRVTVPAFDPASVADAFVGATGVRPRRRLPPELAAACDLSDLCLALLPGREAGECLGALERLLRAKRGTRPGARLEELSGYGEAREWGLALVEDLRHWREARVRFDEIESSILLSGPPGVGKTQYAAALARSADLPLLAGSLAQWQSHRDGHLGHTLAAMRAFFDAARRQPCVALIDEIDSFGDRHRFSEQHRDYSTQVVNALLEHLDGATSRDGVVVVAATNNPEALDPAIRRAGRLDRHVRIGMPDVDALRGILRTCLGGALAGSDLTPVALLALGMTGADASAVVRRASAVARRSARPLTVADLVTAVSVVRPPLPPAVRLRTAIHEAGHGLACILLGIGGLLELSLHADGGTTGTNPAAHHGEQTEEDFAKLLVVSLAGRAAEEEALGHVSAGAVADLSFATRMAALMEARWGFSRTHPLVSIGALDEVDVARMPWLIDPLQARLQGAYDRARELMAAHRHALGRVSEALYREGHLGDAAIRSLVAGAACHAGG